MSSKLKLVRKPEKLKTGKPAKLAKPAKQAAKPARLAKSPKNTPQGLQIAKKGLSSVVETAKKAAKQASAKQAPSKRQASAKPAKPASDAKTKTAAPDKRYYDGPSLADAIEAGSKLVEYSPVTATEQGGVHFHSPKLATITGLAYMGLTKKVLAPEAKKVVPKKAKRFVGTTNGDKDGYETYQPEPYMDHRARMDALIRITGTLDDAFPILTEKLSCPSRHTCPYTAAGRDRYSLYSVLRHLSNNPKNKLAVLINFVRVFETLGPNSELPREVVEELK